MEESEEQLEELVKREELTGGFAVVVIVLADTSHTKPFQGKNLGKPSFAIVQNISQKLEVLGLCTVA